MSDAPHPPTSPNCEHPPVLVGMTQEGVFRCRACKRSWRLAHGLFAAVVYQGWRRPVGSQAEWEKVQAARHEFQGKALELLMDESELKSGQPFGHFEYAFTEGEAPTQGGGRGQYSHKMMIPRW